MSSYQGGHKDPDGKPSHCKKLTGLVHLAWCKDETKYYERGQVNC